MQNGESDLKLQDEEFITGSDMIFHFTILDRNGKPLILTGCEIKWTLCYLDQKETPIVRRDNKTLGGVSIIGDGLCRVDVARQDTESLYDGTYEQELIIIQTNGEVLRPCYGYLHIKQGSFYKS